MNLGAISIRRGVTTAMVYLCLTGFGFFTLYNLPVNRFPEVDLPVIAVITTYVGASPEDVETLVTAPIERAISSVEGVEVVRSTTRQGTSIVIVSFGWGRDMDDAETDVRKNIELFAADLLPDETSRPLTFAFDPSLDGAFRGMADCLQRTAAWEKLSLPMEKGPENTVTTPEIEGERT